MIDYSIIVSFNIDVDVDIVYFYFVVLSLLLTQSIESHRVSFLC